MATTTHIDNAALFALLSSLADNKQALGRHYAYWCNGAPALEACVAAAAMAQDELGHARTLYPLLADFTQSEAAPEQIEPTTRTLRYHLAALDIDFPGWTDFVATNFLLDTALTTFFEAARDSSYEPLRQRARKMIQEERVHFVHGVGWVRRLAKAGGAVRSTLIASLQRLWDETLCWFGPPDDPSMQRLYQEKVLDATPDELRDRYLQKVIPVLSELGIDMLLKNSCERRLGAASESATNQVGQADHVQGNESATQALSLTQLNGSPASFNPKAQTWQLAQDLPWSRWNPVSRRLES